MSAEIAKRLQAAFRLRWWIYRIATFVVCALPLASSYDLISERTLRNTLFLGSLAFLGWLTYWDEKLLDATQGAVTDTSEADQPHSTRTAPPETLPLKRPRRVAVKQ
jgi:hypothetical protein